MNRSLAGTHDTSEDARSRNGSGDLDRATLRDRAQPFDFSPADKDRVGESRCDDDASTQAPPPEEITSPPEDSSAASDAGEAAQSDGATLRNQARPFRFPARLIDRPPTPSERAEERLRKARGERRPRPEPADSEELRAAWSWEFSAEARLTERQKNAIALILAGEKEVRIARRIGVNRGTLWRWRRHDQNFRRALDFARRRAYALAAEQLRELVPRAIQIVQNELDRDNFQAALRVLRIARLDQNNPVFPVTP